MYADARLRATLASMMAGIDAPPVPLASILEKLSEPERPVRTASRFGFAAAVAAAATIAIAVPAISTGAVQSLEARIAAVLGWEPPPPAPASLDALIRTQAASLASARTRVPFTLVAPAGLPSDVTSVSITTTPSEVYSKVTRSWRLGSPEVTFAYTRAGARSFSLMADVFDPRTGLPPKYMFEDRGTAPGGNEILVRHEHIAWRNGDQVMDTVADDGISVPEIEAIRAAMNGVALPLASSRATLRGGTEVKKYLLRLP